jgi:DNA modification methylase
MPALQTNILQGDCLEVLKEFPDEHFDLIFTSPPYADRRKNTYGGTKPEHYVKWFLPRAAEFQRVLKRSGSFVLNIKEKAEEGERHTFVIELILALRQNEWKWTEEYIWHKRNCHPGKWPNRFRDAWERCLHFTRDKHFKMNQEAVMVPMGDWKEKRLRSLGKNDVVRFQSQVGSGFGKNIANWKDREMAFPSNVLHLATECGNKSHSAAFPKTLPEWFIKLFSDPGDWILDPFVGSGTTCVAAQELGRNSIGIDIKRDFTELAEEEVEDASMAMFDKAAKQNGYDKKNK